MRHWMFNCREISHLVSEALDRQLPPTQRAAIHLHLAMCRYCARFKKQLLALRAASSLPPQTPGDDREPSGKLPEEARLRIKKALQNAGEVRRD
jgi:hypothetical protein